MTVRFSSGNTRLIISGLVLFFIFISIGYLANRSFVRCRESVESTLNRTQMTGISQRYIRQIVEGQARVYDAVFNRVEAASVLLARQAVQVYDNIDFYGSHPLNEQNFHLDPDTGIFLSRRRSPVITAYWGGRQISQDRLKELKALSHLVPCFFHCRAMVEESFAIRVVTPSGIGLFHPMIRGADLKMAGQVWVPEPDDTGKPPVIFPAERRDEGIRSSWTGIYREPATRDPVITVTTPIKDPAGHLRGMVGIDLHVRAVADLMKTDLLTRQNRDGAPRYGFILGPGGDPVVLTDGLYTVSFCQAGADRSGKPYDISDGRFAGPDSDSLTAMVRQGAQIKNGVSKVSAEGREYYLGVGQVKAVGWRIVLVFRNRDLLSALEDSRQTLSGNLSAIWTGFIWRALLIIILSYVVVILLFRLDESERFRRPAEQKVENRANDRTHDLARLNDHLVLSEEKQRRRIAADLHDGVAQTLCMGISKIQVMAEAPAGLIRPGLLEVSDCLEQAVGQIRALIYQLAPPLLEEFGLEIALGHLIEELNAGHRCEIDYVSTIPEPFLLDRVTEVTLYRAAAELMTNVLKHSGAGQAWVDLSVSRGRVILRVRDDGCGFSPADCGNHQSSGFGLQNLKEGLLNMNGGCDIRSGSGKGTTVTVHLPANAKMGNAEG